MAEPALVFDEHDLYPVHEEDSVPQTPLHHRESYYLVYGLQTHLPDLWVTGDICLYWIRDTHRYVAPDVAVIACPPPVSPPNVHLKWLDPPVLFVGEIGSRSTLVVDTGPKVSLYEQLVKAPEYLHADPVKGTLMLWRMVDGRYQQVQRDRRGRVHSQQLGVSFGYDRNGFLRAYDSHGRMLLTHEEEARRADAEASRADAEASRANEEASRARDAIEGSRALEEEVQRLRAELASLHPGGGAFELQQPG